jgi:AcrR family transcriptional regulator
MPRIVKEDEYAVRRNEILDAAQRLVYTKGFGQMTIQDVLDELHISKGAFYHYFDSKHALLEALIERLQAEAEKILVPIVQDAQLSALEKLERYFATAAQWKTAQKAYLLALLRVWYHDDNALVRQKVFASALKQITPLISTIIRQGIQEGVLRTPYPDQAGEVVLSLIQSLGDTYARMLLSPEAEGSDLQHIERVSAAYSDALERILGAPPGSVHLVDTATLAEWFPTQEKLPDGAREALTEGIRVPEA